MEPHPDWESDEVYLTGDYAVHDGQLYVAAEPVARTAPDPHSTPGHGPWLLLGRYEPLL
jgi:hypothetical protein